MHISRFVYIHIYGDREVYKYSYIRTYIHTYIQTDRQTDRHTDICRHIKVYEGVSTCAVFTHAETSTYMLCSYMLRYIHTSIHPCMHA